MLNMWFKICDLAYLLITTYNCDTNVLDQCAYYYYYYYNGIHKMVRVSAAYLSAVIPVLIC